MKKGIQFLSVFLSVLMNLIFLTQAVAGEIGANDFRISQMGGGKEI
ncbi:hypothetical protein K1X76_06385 [bacterium]|nr:hypothetical protein [bacterium]